MINEKDISFVGHLVYEVTELFPLLRNHLTENQGEILPYYFLYEVINWMIGQHSEGDSESIVKVFAVVDSTCSNSDVDVTNLIEVGFLEFLSQANPPAKDLRQYASPALTKWLNIVEKREGFEPI